LNVIPPILPLNSIEFLADVSSQPIIDTRSQNFPVVVTARGTAWIMTAWQFIPVGVVAIDDKGAVCGGDGDG
jgi:hypothetical protein